MAGDVGNTKCLIMDINSEDKNFRVELAEFIAFDNSDNEDYENTIQNNIGKTNETKPVILPSIHSYTVINNVLKIEETAIINSCRHLNLRNLLLMNRSKRTQLMQLYKYIKDMILECQENIQSKEHFINNINKSLLITNSFQCTWRLAAPYFKDKDLFPCPFNSDAIRKRKSDELSIYDRGAPMKWTPHECDSLTKAVKLNYNINRQKGKHKQIIHLKSLKEASTIPDKSDLEKEILQLESELEILKTTSEDEIPPLNCNLFIDWYRISDFFLRGKHTPLECKAFWHIYLHPFINKTDWSSEENLKIMELAQKYGFQNWDIIAEELETGRTGFLTCVHYSSILNDKYKKQKFTPEEDRRLMEVVNRSKVGDTIKWSKVSQQFMDRSRTQLFHRYTYYLLQNQKIVKRSKFSEAEDILLLLLVQRFGRNFKKCAEFFPNRTYMQLKNRYNSNLANNIKKGTWSTEDDRVILKFVEQNGSKKWSDLTRVLKRSRGQLRQRYTFLKKFISGNPKIAISKIPKRKHVLFEQEESHYNFMKYIVEKYKNVDYVPSLEMIQNCLEVDRNKNSKQNEDQFKAVNRTLNKRILPVKGVDSLLTEYFYNSYKMKTDTLSKKISHREVLNNVALSMNCLQANLSFPEVFVEDLFLDCIDISILENLHSVKKHIKHFEQVNSFMPPNMNNLVGLRNLLVKYESHRSSQRSKNVFDVFSYEKNETERGLVWSIENTFSHLDDDTQQSIIEERKLFAERFKTLFYWPSVLSLAGPQYFKDVEFQK